jgi:hypothetical protein
MGFWSGSERPLALAGPATVTFPSDSGTNSLPVCICFQRIQGTAIQSLYVPSSGSSTVVQVPAGKVCHLFLPISSFSGDDTENEIFANVQTTSNSVSNIPIFGSEEFPGTANLIFKNEPMYGDSLGSIVSFYLTDGNTLTLPNGVLQAPTGSFVITVEKSTDLTHWSPVIIQPTGNDLAAFYRLNFSH